jgi:hypothetical protein
VGKAALGVSVKLELGLELNVYGSAAPPDGHLIVNELVVALTLSLKLTVTVVLVATPVAALVGVVLETLGGASVVKLKT